MFLSNRPVTKVDKQTGAETLVSVSDVLDFIGKGKKAREEALINLLEGKHIGNTQVGYYIKPLNELYKQESAAFHERTKGI